MKAVAVILIAVLLLAGFLVFIAPPARAAFPLPAKVKTIAVGLGPYMSHYASLTGQTWVGNIVSNNISVIQDANLTVVHTVSSPGPSGIDIAQTSPTTGQVWVASRANGTVRAYGEANFTLLKTLGVGHYPERLETDTVNNTEWVANQYSGNLSIISLSSLTVIRSVSLGANAAPYGITFDAATNQMWVTAQNTSRILVIGASNYTVAINVTAHGTSPAGICYDGNGGIWYPNVASGTAIELSAKTGALLASVTVGTSPYAAACDSNAYYAIIANSGSHNATIINESSHSIVATIQVGSSPFSTRAFDPVRDLIFVPNYGSANVTVIFDGVTTPPSTGSQGPANNGTPPDTTPTSGTGTGNGSYAGAFGPSPTPFWEGTGGLFLLGAAIIGLLYYGVSASIESAARRR